MKKQFLFIICILLCRGLICTVYSQVYSTCRYSGDKNFILCPVDEYAQLMEVETGFMIKYWKTPVSMDCNYDGRYTAIYSSGYICIYDNFSSVSSRAAFSVIFPVNNEYAFSNNGKYLSYFKSDDTIVFLDIAMETEYDYYPGTNDNDLYNNSDRDREVSFDSRLNILEIIPDTIYIFPTLVKRYFFNSSAELTDNKDYSICITQYFEKQLHPHFEWVVNKPSGEYDKSAKAGYFLKQSEKSRLFPLHPTDSVSNLLSLFYNEDQLLQIMRTIEVADINTFIVGGEPEDNTPAVYISPADTDESNYQPQDNTQSVYSTTIIVNGITSYRTYADYKLEVEIEYTKINMKILWETVTSKSIQSIGTITYKYCTDPSRDNDKYDKPRVNLPVKEPAYILSEEYWSDSDTPMFQTSIEGNTIWFQLKGFSVPSTK